MNLPWNIKYNRGQHLELTKECGTTVVVEIESVSMGNHIEQPIYGVREIVTRIGYHAAQSDLKVRKK